MDEIFNVAQYRANVVILFFLLLALKSPFGTVDILPTDDTLFFSFVAVPFADVPDRFDGSELIVTDIDVLRNSGKGFMDTGNR